METDNAAGWALQNNTVTRRYVRLPGSIDEAFLMIDYTVGNPDGGEDGQEIYVHFNRQGSVIATSDINGYVQDKYTYSPFGVSGSTNTGFPFRFTGQRLDEETGLYYYKARYYDPETGRFLQVDPIGYEDQQNLYAYVGNDPVNRIDPTGEADTVPEARYMSRDDQCDRACWERMAILVSFFIPGPEDLVLAAWGLRSAGRISGTLWTAHKLGREIDKGGRLVLYSGKIPSSSKAGDIFINQKRGWTIKGNDRLIRTAIKKGKPIGDSHVDETGELILGKKGSVIGFCCKMHRDGVSASGERVLVQGIDYHGFFGASFREDDHFAGCSLVSRLRLELS